ncbi:orf75 [Alcelaphine gammaherpesvirus 2]|uniref:Orf75 n=1 Tax=Alcelaphine gammaherpesvirus 2 TaxID=138184 RepID=A0A068A9X7_9GAMA|nr:orf75 [Alcelaphine gammaherpesvirus 2]AIA62109.1 orf75 [Alcelaphine gammaherpesvirus 2]
MSLYLLPNIRRVFKDSLTKTWFVDTEYSIEEEQLVMKFMDTRGELSLVSGTIFSELIIIVSLETSHTAAEDDLDYEKILASVQELLSPLMKNAAVNPISKYPKRQRTVKIMYGPDLKRIPTNFSRDVVDLLQQQDISSVMRVEVSRCLTFDNRHELSEMTYDIVLSEIKSKESEITYSDDFQNFTINTEPIHYASDIIQVTGTGDYVCDKIMKKTGGDPPFAQQVAFLPNVSIPSTSVATALSFKLRAAVNFTKEMSSFHYAILQSHGNLGFIHQQTDGLRMQRSIMLENSPLASCLGAYMTDFQFNCRQGYSDMKELYSSIMVQGATHIRAGSPTITGFVRLLGHYGSLNLKMYRPMLYECHLASSIGSNLKTAEYGPGNILVAIGQFYPAVLDDTHPFHYRDNMTDYNKVVQTLSGFYSTVTSPCVTSSLRDLGNKTVKQHLFALLKNGGANLYISCLPQALVFQLRRIPETEWLCSLEHLLDVYFFNTYSNLLFLTVKNTSEYTILGQQFKPVEILQQVARIFRCNLYILGETVDKVGIHVINDLGNPYSFTARRHCGKHCYSLFKPPETPEGYGLPGHGEEEELECVVVTPNPDWAQGFVIEECINNVLLSPTVGSKAFVVNHIDRCGNGLVVQQPGVGRLDLPLADYGLVLHSMVKPPMGATPDSLATWKSLTLADLLKINNAEVHENMPASCMAVGEQPLKVAISPSNGALYAMAELLTNLMLGPKMLFSNIIITASASWEAGHSCQELKTTLRACRAFAEELGVNFIVSSASSSVPQDSRYLDTRSANRQHARFFRNIVFSGTCKVTSLKRAVPVLQKARNSLVHVSIDPTDGLGGTVFENVYGLSLGTVSKISAQKMAALFTIIQDGVQEEAIVSGHDVSDGGLVACLVELCLSTDFVVRVTIPEGLDPFTYLFAESPGAVVEVPSSHLDTLKQKCSAAGLFCEDIGYISSGDEAAFSIVSGGKIIFERPVYSLRTAWSTYSDTVVSVLCSDLDEDERHKEDYGCNEVDFRELKEDLLTNYVAFYYNPDIQNKVAVLTWPGMVKEEPLFWAMTNAQFDVYVVCVTEINSPSFLNDFRGLVIGSGIGYTEPIVAATGALMAMINTQGTKLVLRALLNFFTRPDTFSLGCGEYGFYILSQFIYYLHEQEFSASPQHQEFKLSPISLEKTKSGTYESRWLSVHVPETTPSLMLAPCRGMVLPCWVQGTYLGLSYQTDGVEHQLFNENLVACSFHGRSSDPRAFARHYPRNPSGNSSVAGICSNDGRHLAMLPDPSLSFFPFQWQHLPRGYEQLKTSPWSLMFYHMHMWCYS